MTIVERKMKQRKLDRFPKSKSGTGIQGYMATSHTRLVVSAEAGGHRSAIAEAYECHDVLS